ncbi:cupin domain-containing protein [Streptomyces sp. NPDC055078]
MVVNSGPVGSAASTAGAIGAAGATEGNTKGNTKGCADAARRARGAMALAGCLAAVATVPSSANATPGSGVSGTVLAQGSSDAPLRLRSKGRTDVVVSTITIDPGGSTGWHHHAGQLLVVVKSGTLTRTLRDCSVEVSPAGSAFIEPSGRRHRHIGRNLGTEPVVLYATYLVPKGDPLSEDAEAPSCAGE